MGIESRYIQLKENNYKYVFTAFAQFQSMGGMLTKEHIIT